MHLPKYALAAYDAEDLQHDDIWALCEDAEALFADPPPRARARYELLGCIPQGELAAAVEAALADGSAPLGFLALEILDKAHTGVGEWYLEDVRVLGARRCARDLSRLDLAVEASEADEQSDYPQCPPLSPGYRLLGPADEPWGPCRDLARVRDGDPAAAAPEEPPVRLLGCAPRGALRTALDAGKEALGHAALLRLDESGKTLEEAAEGELIAWIPSARGRGLVDLSLDPWSDRPPPVARQVWDTWWPGRPTEPNLWAPLTTEGRHHWMGTALVNRARYTPDAGPGATYHLDGRHITDVPGFYCALSEAVNGPGGYYGRNLDAVNDCLRGGFGARSPFTLVWHDAHIARSCLGLTPRVDQRPHTFEEILTFLAEAHVQVELA
ncbi:barstar family protein [Actinomycetota bacterium Odt1-20B]